MKIIVNKSEFAALVRACYRQMSSHTGVCCGTCVLHPFCSENDELVESMCEIFELEEE